MNNTKNNPPLEAPNETMEARYSWFILKDPWRTSLPDNFIVRGNLDLRGTAITALPDNLTVGGGLYLSGTQITALPDNLTVGGSLDLSGTAITSLPDNLTVGGSLNLRGTRITSLPDNLTVGGGLFLSGTQITAKERRKVRILRPNDCVEGKYIFADGILTHICGKPHKRGKYTYYNGKIKGQNVIFDGENYAHCKDFKSGVIDLQYKAAKDRGAEQYKKLNLDSVVTYDEAVIMYRVITGACSAGTEQFLSNLREKKEKYTIAEAIQLTDGQYGSAAFKRFFTAKEE